MNDLIVAALALKLAISRGVSSDSPDSDTSLSFDSPETGENDFMGFAAACSTVSLDKEAMLAKDVTLLSEKVSSCSFARLAIGDKLETALLSSDSRDAFTASSSPVMSEIFLLARVFESALREMTVRLFISSLVMS